MTKNKQIQKIGLTTAITIVVANMIGTGVFTSLGFQLAGITHTFTILALWIIGGITALSGAFSYGELGSLYPRSGGEYQFLGKIYSPFVGFLSGWISVIVGFTAPIAAAAIAAGKYSSSVLKDTSVITESHQDLTMKIIAIFLTIIIAFVHTKKIKTISIFQNFFTCLKILLIITLIFFGFILSKGQNISFLPTSESFSAIFTGAFAVSLVFVMYAYSGWNASAYISSEIKNPKKNMPLSLFLGTLIVILLYVPVNAVFLYSTPASEMVMQEEVGYIAATHIFGHTGGIIMGLLISIGLISAISSMTWAGPRVIQVIGEDYKTFRFFARKNKNDIPAIAIVFQTIIVLFMVITSTFESIIYYIGFTLTLSSFMTVLGVYVLRIKKPELERTYKTWGYPITPAIFLLVTGWMMFYIIKDKPITALYSVITIAVGAIVYIINKKISNKKQQIKNENE
ncbi:MAG: amino acid permease [Bacteroidales bacterium]|nr:amino acid permease [Bacteroidales bacterium]